MFSAETTRGTVTSKRPDFRLEFSMSPVIERSTTDNVLQCVSGGSRFHQARWSHYQLLAKKEVTCRVLSITLFTLSCQPCLTRYHFLSFLDTRVCDCSSFPHRLTFTTPPLRRRFRTVVTMESGTPCMKLVRFLVAFCFASSEQVTVHTRPTRTASLCQQRFWKLIQKVWVVQRQVVHTRARMAINHD